MHPMPSALDATEFSRTPRLNSTLCEEPARAASCRQRGHARPPAAASCVCGVWWERLAAKSAIGTANGKRKHKRRLRYAAISSRLCSSLVV